MNFVIFLYIQNKPLAPQVPYAKTTDTNNLYEFLALIRPVQSPAFGYSTVSTFFLTGLSKTVFLMFKLLASEQNPFG